MFMKSRTLLHVLVVSSAFFVVPKSAADAIADVVVDTSSLSANGQSEIVLVLTGTSGNTVTLSNFTFGGGAAGAVDAATTTNATGDMFSTVFLNDILAFTSIFAEYFTAGTALSFHFETTTIADAVNPDQFSFQLFGPSINQQFDNPLVTSDPTGSNSLLQVNFTSASPNVETFACGDGTNPCSIAATSVPEPSSGTLLGVAFFWALWLRLRSRWEAT